jgi:hypothetical protein
VVPTWLSPTSTTGSRASSQSRAPKERCRRHAGRASGTSPTAGRLYFSIRVGPAIATDTHAFSNVEIRPEPLAYFSSGNQFFGVALGLDFGRHVGGRADRGGLRDRSGHARPWAVSPRWRSAFHATASRGLALVRAVSCPTRPVWSVWATRSATTARRPAPGRRSRQHVGVAAAVRAGVYLVARTLRSVSSRAA